MTAALPRQCHALVTSNNVSLDATVGVVAWIEECRACAKPFAIARRAGRGRLQRRKPIKCPHCRATWASHKTSGFYVTAPLTPEEKAAHVRFKQRLNDLHGDCSGDESSLGSARKGPLARAGARRNTENG
jgi:hypothetical protein